MAQFFSNLCRYIKSKFVRNPSFPAPSKLNDFSNFEYENLFMELLDKVEKGSSWGELQGFLMGKKLDKQTLAKWLRGFGERWLEQPKTHQELARRLSLLGRLATGELAEVAKSLSERLSCVGEKENQNTSPSIKLNAINQEINIEKLKKDGNYLLEIIKSSTIEVTELQIIIKGISPDMIAYLCLIHSEEEAKKGNFEKALLFYDETIKVQPAFYQLCQIVEKQGNSSLWNQYVEVYNMLWTARGAVLCDEFEMYQESIIAFEKAIEIYPDNPLSWHNMAEAFLKLNQYSEVIRCCNKAFEIDPLFFQIGEVFHKKGLALSGINQHEEAIYYYDKSLNIKLKNYLVWINRCFSANRSFSCNHFLSSMSEQNHRLKKRGYEGAIISCEEGLKYCTIENDPKGWGKLHQTIGYMHYYQGKRDLYPSRYWNQALESYNRALSTLTKDDYPEEHLEVLQDLIQVQLALGKTEIAEQLRIQGLEMLFKLLNSKKLFTLKKKLTLRFIGFYQLEVDILVNKRAFSQALMKAELNKNICLTNILFTWQENILSPSYEKVQQLLTPGTAIVYWNISPQAITTFILKENITEPIVIPRYEPKSDLKQPSRSMHIWQEFTAWLEEWNQQYQDYGCKTKEQKEGKRANHPWRKEMTPRLKKLKTILDIDKIESHLSDITRLILIPHQDLHRLPLHVLFEPSLTQIIEDKRLTINYYPSAQIAITLQQKQANHEQLSLLSVENPSNDLPYAEIESTIINQMFTNPPTYIGTKIATNPAVKAALQQSHHIFHFTGHGAYNQRQPENSFLSLTGEHKLTVQEITKLNLKSYQLISLSACETGITGNQTIDTEYVGLVSAFLQAGAASVLHTLWTVEEISSAWLMIRFYQLFLDGIAPAFALQQSQQWLRTRTYAQFIPWIDNLAITISNSHPNVSDYLQTIIWDIQQDSDKMNSSSPPYAHPYYWAAFTLTGGNTR